MARNPATMSPEEIQEEVRQAAIENRYPFERDVEEIAPVPLPPSSEDRQVISRADLVQSLSANGEWYYVPGIGKGLYVFGVSDADFRLLLQWSLEKSSADPAAAVANTNREELINQIILCTRQGPTLQSSPVFTRADRDVVSKYLGFAVINEIVAVSNRLSGNDETFGMGVRSFFGIIRRNLRTLSSGLETWEDCPPGLKDTLPQLESLVSRALTRGRLDSGLLQELQEL